MSPTTKHNISKPATVSASVTKKVKKAAPKASTTATLTINGEVIVQHILQGSYVHDSDHANRIIKLSLAITHTMHFTLQIKTTVDIE